MCVQEVVNVYCKQIFFIGRRLLGHTVCYLNIIMFRVQFTCNGCKPYHLILSTIRTMVLISGGQKAKRFFCSFFRRGGGVAGGRTKWLYIICQIERFHYKYPIFVLYIYIYSDHQCVSSGMESLAREFQAELLAEVEADPCQAMPALYNSMRYV